VTDTVNDKITPALVTALAAVHVAMQDPDVALFVRQALLLPGEEAPLLVTTPAPAEETDGLTRFRVDLEFAVRQSDKTTGPRNIHRTTVVSVDREAALADARHALYCQLLGVGMVRGKDDLFVVSGATWPVNTP
jgi:hypothetical protein